jgi:ketosteroid isomerase-like protein
MGHPNEERLRDLYTTFAEGDLDGFLAGCTDDVTFTVPGNTPGSGTFNRDEFGDWIVGVLGQTTGTFEEQVLDVFANDDHALMLLHHEFDRDGVHREYGTSHILELRDGLIATWTEHPGSLREFEEAWGIQEPSSRAAS